MEEEIGSVSINVFTKERKIMTSEGWKDLPEGEVRILYKSSGPKWFDTVSSFEQGSNAVLQHNMNAVPEVVCAKSLTYPSGFYYWKDGVEHVEEPFHKLSVHNVTDCEISFDATGLGAKYVLYFFSNDGYTNVGLKGVVK